MELVRFAKIMGVLSPALLLVAALPFAGAGLFIDVRFAGLLGLLTMNGTAAYNVHANRKFNLEFWIGVAVAALAFWYGDLLNLLGL